MRSDDELLQIFVIFGCFEAPILRPFGSNRCKKMSSETNAKSVQTWARRPRE